MSLPRPRTEWRRSVCTALACSLMLAAPAAWPATIDAPATVAPLQPADLVKAYAKEVDRRLTLPEPDQVMYAERLARALHAAGVHIDRPQFVVLVDRSAQVQAAMLWWLAPDAPGLLIGASPVSTGRPSGFEHFETPTGVFDHTLADPDFRAEGTPNELGLLGYGRQGMRVYDFGWVMARRGWAPGEQPMRLQMHATDPDRLEPRLGQRESKGCIRIPATLDRLIDHYAVLDAAYDEALREGHRLWVLRADRVQTPWSGRYLVIVDSQRTARPAWADLPRRARPLW